MTFGLEPNQFQILEELVISPLKKHGYRLWVFGSRARGDQQKFSDIDILYREPESLQKPSLIGEVTEAIENSNLVIKVDLVDEKHLAASYRDNVLKDRVEI